MLHICQKTGEEELMLEYHGKLEETSVADQMCLAALHFLRGNYEDSVEIYKKLQSEKDAFDAINVYMALCYFKQEYFEVAIDLLVRYLSKYPTSVIGYNLRTCCAYLLQNGKAAEAELKLLLKEPHQGNLLQDNDLLRHNMVVIRNGENALQILPPLVDVLPEARLNLTIHHLKNSELEQAFNVVKDLKPTQPKEFIIKATVHAMIGQATGDREHLKVAQQLFQLIGGSASECDTIPGRQCMASCFFLLKQFDDVLVYLRSIREFFQNDSNFNWNFGIALAATGDFAAAEEAFQAIKDETYQEDPVYLSWLCKCYIINGKPEYFFDDKNYRLAWDIYCNMEASNESLVLLSMIGNECYKMGHFYFALKAFDVLSRLDPDPEFYEGKQGAAVGVFQMVIAGKERKERMAEVISSLKSTGNPQNEYIVNVMKKWAKEQGMNFSQYQYVIGLSSLLCKCWLKLYKGVLGF
eukprot:TRINITY_DN71360_c0_g1_i1.p1 TRINITY_DN71360_c0_g1~~TRINITY_DN71360_c0_g1_i1.p1  ORF type:complete len:467 (+),score=58.47 TRINITY_DN71360_c0_g1_i1:607-2007(+)